MPSSLREWDLENPSAERRGQWECDYDRPSEISNSDFDSAVRSSGATF